MQDSIRGTFLESVPPSEIELSDCFVLFRGIAVGFPEFQLFTNFSAIFFLTGFGANLRSCLTVFLANAKMVWRVSNKR